MTGMQFPVAVIISRFCANKIAFRERFCYIGMRCLKRNSHFLNAISKNFILLTYKWQTSVCALHTCLSRVSYVIHDAVISCTCCIWNITHLYTFATHSASGKIITVFEEREHVAWHFRRHNLGVCLVDSACSEFSSDTHADVSWHFFSWNKIQFSTRRDYDA